MQPKNSMAQRCSLSPSPSYAGSRAGQWCKNPDISCATLANQFHAALRADHAGGMVQSSLMEESVPRERELITWVGYNGNCIQRLNEAEACVPDTGLSCHGEPLARGHFGLPSLVFLLILD